MPRKLREAFLSNQNEPLAKLRIRTEFSSFEGVRKEKVGGHYWQDVSDETNIDAHYEVYATRSFDATLEGDSVRSDS